MSPCTPKHWRVGRWDNGAGQASPSLKTGAGHNKTLRPGRPRLPHPPCKTRTIVLCCPQEVGSRSTPLPRSLPHSGALGTHGGPLRREALGGASPAAAVAATNPALGQGALGGCSSSPATLRGSPAPEPTPLQDELLEAIQLHYGSVTVRYGSITAPLPLRCGSLRPITPLLRLHAYTHRNPAVTRHKHTSKAGPFPRLRERGPVGDGGAHLLGGYGQVQDRRADGVGDRVGDCRGDRRKRPLADLLEAVRPQAALGPEQHRL